MSRLPIKSNMLLFLTPGGDILDQDTELHLLPEQDTQLDQSFSFLLRRNLFCVLHRLRRKDRDIRLWVDALCINQNDLSEKTHQLKKMTDIQLGQKSLRLAWRGRQSWRELPCHGFYPTVG